MYTAGRPVPTPTSRVLFIKARCCVREGGGKEIGPPQNTVGSILEGHGRSNNGPGAQTARFRELSNRARITCFFGCRLDKIPSRILRQRPGSFFFAVGTAFTWREMSSSVTSQRRGPRAISSDE